MWGNNKVTSGSLTIWLVSKVNKKKDVTLLANPDHLHDLKKKLKIQIIKDKR